MLQKIKTINLLVHDFKEATSFYTEKLGFELHQNFPEQNWVTLVIPGSKDLMIALCLADEESKPCVGRQTGSFGMFILVVDDCKSEYERMAKAGVTFTVEPTTSQHGTYALLKDLYGNNIFMTDK